MRMSIINVMHSVFLRATIWLLAEVVLTAIGIDDLADYGEYLFKVKDRLLSRQSAIAEHVITNSVCFPSNLATHAIPIFVSTP
jgi:hypothetical protein